jgi:hypothetical protein
VRQLKDTAQLLHTEPCAVLAHEPEYRCRSFEKMGTAFLSCQAPGEDARSRATAGATRHKKTLNF